MDLIESQLPAITGRCRELGWISPDTRLARPAAAGEGNMNRTLRVQLESRTAREPESLILKQAVPFVAKYPSIAAPVARGATEAAFYQQVSKDAQLARCTPSLYGFDPEHHLLCLEDLGPGTVMTHLYEQPSNRKPDHAASLVEFVAWLSHLHALSADDSSLLQQFPNNSAMRELNHEHLFAVPFNVDSGVELTAPWADLRLELASDTPFLMQAEHLGNIYLGRAAHRSVPVLLHGDFYPGSWLIDAQLHSRIIDPEFGFVGPAEFDIGVMLAHLTFAGFSQSECATLASGYQQPPGFEPALMRQFCAIEVLRRLLGVAQLPLAANVDTQLGWATHAHKILAGRS